MNSITKYSLEVNLDWLSCMHFNQIIFGPLNLLMYKFFEAVTIEKILVTIYNAFQISYRGHSFSIIYILTKYINFERYITKES